MTWLTMLTLLLVLLMTLISIPKARAAQTVFERKQDSQITYYGGTMEDYNIFATVTDAKVWTLLSGSTLQVQGDFYYKTKVVTNNTSATATQLTAAQSGAVCCLNDEAGTSMGNVTFKLPAAAAGLKFTFVDGDPTAAADLWITAASGDKINGGTAGKSYVCTGDAVKQFVTLVALDDTRWEIVAEAGTWANDNN
jgi:hypothetical protein